MSDTPTVPRPRRAAQAPIRHDQRDQFGYCMDCLAAWPCQGRVAQCRAEGRSVL